MVSNSQRSTLLRTLGIAVVGFCLPLLWPGVFANLFSTHQFEIDRHDSGWPAALMVLHVGSDLLIGISYAAISSVLAYIVYRNRSALPFDWVVLAFGLFIVACGLTHLMHVLVRFTPVFWFDGYIRALTAIVSVATALALPPLIPRVSALIQAERRLRDHQVQLEETNAALASSVARSEFLAGLSDALQTARDPRDVAELALTQLGPVLNADQITAIRIHEGRGKLWSSWGEVHPTALQLLSGEGSPIEQMTMVRRAVETGEVQATGNYGDIPGAVRIAGRPISALVEPIHEVGGRVIGTLNFIRAAGKPWQPDELELTRRAAATISLALERTQSAQALQESEAQLKEAMRHAPLGEVVVGPDRRVERVNPAASRILERREEDLTGLTLEELLGSGGWPSEPGHHPLPSDPTKTDWEQRYSRPDGTDVWLQIHASPIEGASEPAQTLIVQFQDSTEKHLAHLELQQLSRQLERSNHDLQQFASVASHDLQEPVRKILAFGSRLQESDQERLSEGGRRSLERMLAAAERMQQLIRDLLALSSVSTSERDFQPVALGKVLELVIEDLDERLTRTGGQVEFSSLPTIPADPSQIRQLLQNLVGNALKYHREGVPPRVHVSASPSESGTARLLIQDNGIGFDPRYAERIFQPFQRLHGRAQYEGTGIGLAICRRIVERHGGTLTATSTEGVGTTFALTLLSEDGSETNL